MHLGLEVVAWVVGVGWLSRCVGAWRGLPRVSNLLLEEHDRWPEGSPTLTVIVPARNEEKDVRACVESLLAQDYMDSGALRVIAIDDRSTDETGSILDEMALANTNRLTVLHVRELPADWLGKTHAMALAAREATTEYLLFTDADILFAPSALRRALVYAEASRADHLVVMPTTISKRWDEAALLSFVQIFQVWGPRPWKVADARTKDAIGVGAFNLMRRSAYEQIGGFEGLRMQIVEDISLARTVKKAGLRQRIAFGRGLVSVHWAAGVAGLSNVMTKNFFAALNFNLVFVFGGCSLLLVFAVLPFVGLFVPAFTLPCAVAVLSIAWAYWMIGRTSGLSGWNAMLAPFAASVFLFSLLRSTVVTLRQGGVVWRGTFYPLAKLKEHVLPLR